MSYDVIVVGAGASGATLAARLSEDPACQVLLLEAGSVERDTEADRLSNVTFALTRRDWAMSAEVVPGRTVPFPQGRAAGGGSAVNMALALRPLPEDLDAWAAAGNPGWSWADMLPVLRRMEDDPLGSSDVHGRSGPIPITRWGSNALTAQSRAFLAACREVGLAEVVDHNDGVSSGVGAFPMNRRGDERVSTAIAYLEPARTRPNLEVRGEVLIERVVFDERRATGVVLRSVAGASEVLSATRIVICAGAIHSPAILLRSGIGAASALDALGIAVVADLAGVGANLMEHPGAFLFVIPNDGVCDTTEVQFQLGARTTAIDSADRNDLLLGMMNHWDLRATPEFRDLVGHDVIFALTCGVLSPRSRGSVTLSSTDPSVAPTIALNLCDDPEDVRRLVEALKLQYRIATSAAMAPRIRGFAMIDEQALAAGDDDALAAYVRAVCAPWYHPSGTCRMGPNADVGTVVGADLAVHGIDGLFVADASIMPVIPRATTNLSAIAIGERAAEILSR